MLYKVVLTFESVDEILKCDHSNESHWAAFPLYNVYYAVQGGSNFWVCGWSPLGWPFKWKLQSYFPVVLFIMLYKVVLTFESGDQIIKCYYSNEDSRKKDYEGWRMVKSETPRDAEILVRNPSPRLFGEKFRDSKKVKTNHEKTRLRDLSKTLPRFRDTAEIFRDPRFSRYHSPPLLWYPG